MASPKFVGITVMPEYFQSESINGVLDNLESKAAATAVTTSPYVMQAADRQTGFREPPIDAGAGKVRLLDRTLWGERELWVRTAPSLVSESFGSGRLPAFGRTSVSIGGCATSPRWPAL